MESHARRFADREYEGAETEEAGRKRVVSFRGRDVKGLRMRGRG